MKWVERIDTAGAAAAVRGALWATAAFCVVLSVLLVATWVQTRLHDPLDTPALVQLVEQLDRDPDHAALREQIRALDLLSRKAYFTTLQQLRTGAVLLIGAVALMVLLGKLLAALGTQAFTPPAPLAQSWWERQSSARIAVAVVGGSLVGIALISAVALHGEFVASPGGRPLPPPATAAQMERNWPAFRGPGSNGIAFTGTAPLDWDGATMKGVRWKSAVPRPGNSSPVVWEDRVFVTGADRDAREVYCFSLRNGRLLWRRSVELPAARTAPLPAVDRETGYAAPTMACDGSRVFALFATGELVCFDLDGKQLWTLYLGVPENHYGHSSSLITHGDLLYVQFDHTAGGKLLALSVTTGATAWEVARQELSWASPICVSTGRRTELIVVDNRTAASFDPATGTALWSHECLDGEVGPSAAFAAGRVFTANEYASATAIDVGSPDPDGIAPILWQWYEILPNTASPVATEHHVFFACAFGTISCVDARQGTTVWTAEFDKGFYASPILAANRVYALDRSGVMHVFEPAGEYRPLGSYPLGEPAVATPAFVEGLIVIRGEENLYCIEGT